MDSLDQPDYGLFCVFLLYLLLYAKGRS